MDENNTLFIPKGYELKNIYHFETWDRDGNKTGEAYGDNIITASGLAGWGDAYNTPGKRIWIGTGTGTPRTTDSSLFNVLYLEKWSFNISDAFYAYPQTYDPNTGIITQKYRLYTNFVVPYNIDGVTTDQNVTEFGIGTDGNTLCTHGLIRDEQGNPSYIVKRVNEQMTITVYLSASVHERFYQDIFDNGMLGNPPVRMMVTGVNAGVLGCRNPYLYFAGETSFDSKGGSDPYPSYRGVRNGSSYAYGPNDGRCNRYAFNTPAVTIESGVDFFTSTSWTSNHNLKYYTSAKVFDVNDLDVSIPFRNPESEEIAFNRCRTNAWNSEYFDSMFRITYAGGWDNKNSNGRIPVIDISNLHSYMYNHIDKEWNIEEQIEYEPDVEWRIRNWHVQQLVYMRDDKNVARNVAVFTNDNIDVPIYAFNNTGIVLYATDKWWDPQSWSKIEDLTNLDPSQRNARYYLFIYSSSGVVLYPDRHWKKPKYVLSQTYNYTPYDDPYTAYRTRTFIKCYSETLDVYCSWAYILFHPEGCWGAFDSETNPGTVKSITYKYPIELTGLSTNDYGRNYKNWNCPWHKWIINGFLVLRQERGEASGKISGSKVHTLLRIIDINGYKNYEGTNLDDNATITDPTTGFVTDVQLELNNQAYNTAAELSIISDLDRLVIWESNAKQCLIVEITRDANNKPVVTQTTMTTSATENYDSWYMWYGQDKLILRKGFVYDIYSLTTKELLRSVTITDIDPDVTSVSTCVGWKDLMYINATNTISEPRSLYYYNYETDRWSYRLNYYRDTIFDGRMVAYNDECIIFSPASTTDTTASQPCIITANEPELYHGLTSWDHGNAPIKCIASGDLRYLNDGKQLLMLASVHDINDDGYGRYKPQVIDIGYMIDNKSYYTTWCGVYDLPSTRSDFVGSNQMSCFFNGNIILRAGKSGGTDNQTIIYNIIPITNLINHRLTLTSHTISSFNQPMHFNATTMLESQIGINEDYEPSPGKFDNAGKGSVYLVEIKESNDNDDALTLLHRYIPCVRNSDNVIGVYDMIDGVFCKSYGDPMTASTDPVTNPEPNFPAEYTQAEFISVSGSRSSIPLNYVHNHHTVIEWTGTIPTGSSTYKCLFGSSRWSSVEHSMNFYCYGASSGHFEFRRSHTGETGIVGIYNKMIKITASGLVANVLDIDAGTTTAITCNQGNVMDEGMNAMCLFDDSDYTPVEIRNLL
jgi:hypothetical protein